MKTMFLIWLAALLGLFSSAQASECTDYTSNVVAAYSGDTNVAGGYDTSYLYDANSSSYWATAYSPNTNAANTWWEGKLDGTYPVSSIEFTVNIQGADSDTWTVEVGYSSTGSYSDFILLDATEAHTVTDGDVLIFTFDETNMQYPMIWFKAGAYPVAATDLILLGDCIVDVDSGGSDTASPDTGSQDTASQDTSSKNTDSGSTTDSDTEDSATDTNDSATEGEAKCVKVESCSGCSGAYLLGCPEEVIASLFLPLFGWGLRRRRS